MSERSICCARPGNLLVEDGDDFLDDPFLFRAVTLGIVFFQIGPELVAGRHPDRHDGFAFRAEPRIGTERLDLQPVVPRLVVHAERLAQRQVECVGGIRENFFDAQRNLDDGRKRLALLVKVDGFFCPQTGRPAF